VTEEFKEEELAKVLLGEVKKKVRLKTLRRLYREGEYLPLQYNSMRFGDHGTITIPFGGGNIVLAPTGDHGSNLLKISINNEGEPIGVHGIAEMAEENTRRYIKDRPNSDFFL
jgi:hypothetical protein